jgi:uncharacterized protein YaaQ
MNDHDGPQKLVMVILAAAEADRLMHLLVQRRLPATRIGSSGGFLRRGNATVLSGVPESRVADVLAAVREVAPPRPTEPAPPAAPAGQGGVRTSGAVVFVVDVDRFERV